MEQSNSAWGAAWLDRAVRAIWSGATAVLMGFAVTLMIVAVVAFALLIFTHDMRLQARIEVEGCPYAQDPDLRRVGGAREREFRARYCRD